ncbi:MAG: YihY/virulence factor BrkB family protein [Chryseolinea sp.]
MKFKHKRFILQWSPGSIAINWMKKVRFKKHENISLYKILRILFKNLMDNEILDRANGVAYNFILAIFPGIIFLFTLIPYITIYFPEINKESILQFLEGQMPSSMVDVVSSTILDILSNQRGGLLSIGFILALFLSTNGMMALMRAFNASYRTIENRGAIKMRVIATGLTFNMTFVLFLSMILLIVGQLVLDYIMTLSWINISDFAVFLLFVLRFIVIFVSFFLSIATIYYFGPAIHYNWRFFSVGSFLATVLCMAVSYGFSYYVSNFSTYNKVYGSIGVLIAIMVWIQLITIVLLVGYEVNASIHDAVRKEALWQGRRHRIREIK